MAVEGQERVPADHKASGNDACLELARECVAEIEKGRIRYFAAVMCENGGYVDGKHGGSTGCEFAALAGLEAIRDALKRPAAGPNISAPTIQMDYACYDLKRAPLSFDFAPWLIDREMVRVRFGAPGPLRVAFTEVGAGRVVSENNALMLERVIMPMVDMIGGVIDPVAVTSQARAEFYCNRPVVDAAKAGETVPMFRPSAKATEQVVLKLIGKRQAPITITLREALHDSPRNSRTEDWLRFATDLRNAGERVIFLRDTSRADEPLADFETYPLASRNLQIRLALYAQAKQNFFVSNGPVTLAMFSEVPYIFLNEVLDYADSSNKTESWTQWHGTPPGEQVPWVKPNQRIVWAAETYENMSAAWNDFNALKQAA